MRRFLKSLVTVLGVLVSVQTQGVIPFPNGMDPACMADCYEVNYTACTANLCVSSSINIIGTASATLIDNGIVADATAKLSAAGVNMVGANIKVFGGAK